MRARCRSIIRLLYAPILAVGCALPAPPDGGPRDQQGPTVRTSSVPLGATSVQTSSLEWEFDEFVVLNNPGSNLRFSPPLPSEPRFTLRGKSLRVQWDGPLAPDRTYVVQFGSAVKDLHEGNPMSEPFWVFATGAAIDSGQIQGAVLNPLTGAAWDNHAVVLHGADAPDSAMYRAPLYGTRSGKDGHFTLPYLAEGPTATFSLEPASNLRWPGCLRRPPRATVRCSGSQIRRLSATASRRYVECRPIRQESFSSASRRCRTREPGCTSFGATASWCGKAPAPKPGPSRA
ncbi:MAG: hypothetical protein RL104_1034 [Bacteroidota bacterium]